MKRRDKVERVVLHTGIPRLKDRGPIRQNIGNVEDTLVARISPERASFAVEQLKRDYGYPDLDLDQVDEDW